MLVVVKATSIFPGIILFEYPAYLIKFKQGIICYNYTAMKIWLFISYVCKGIDFLQCYPPLLLVLSMCHTTRTTKRQRFQVTSKQAFTSVRQQLDLFSFLFKRFHSYIVYSPLVKV